MTTAHPSIPHRQIRPLMILAALIAILLLGCSKGEQAVEIQPIEVSALRVEPSDVPIEMEFVGQTKGAVDAEIRARVDGVLTGLHFQEGKEVKEGQLLYTIDPAPFLARVAEAKGKVAEAETMLVKAESDLKRIRPLVKMKAMSERDLDRAVAEEGAARATVDAAKAALESSEIQLGYCKIYAPITGIIGLTKAKVGEYVGSPPNPVVLNTVSKLDPIHVLLAITEKDYLYFTRLKQKQIETGESPQKRQLTMILADGSVYPERGEVVSIERAVNAATGSITVEAAFPNPHELMRPGQFAKIRTIAETAKGAIVVPKKALREIQGHFQVVVITSQGTAEARTVKVGATIGERQVIDEGLGAGDVIALDGLQRLKTGTPVVAKFAN